MTALRRAGVKFGEHPYHHDPAHTDFGAEAVDALRVPADQVFKTLVCRGVDDHDLVVAVVPVSRRLDVKALARHTGHKRLTMADPALAERATGYLVGGISPFGQRRRLRTVIDESAVGLPRLYVSGGRRGLDVSLGVSDALALLDASTAPIAVTHRAG